MEELWGLKSILDANSDLAVFIIDKKTKKILFCNHLFTIKTGRHSGEIFTDIWHEANNVINTMEDGRTLRFVSTDTPFGKCNNVTVTQLVWEGGIKAYGFAIANHVENKEEQTNAIIFNALGKAYKSMYDLDIKAEELRMIIKPLSDDLCVYRPTPYKYIVNILLEKYIHSEDIESAERFFDLRNVIKETKENGDYAFQVRTKFNDGEYHWTEYRFTWMMLGLNDEHIVCYQRDVNKKAIVNQAKLENEMILKTICNNYRSIYLLDLDTGEYSTVKPDVLLFGIPSDGIYSELLQIVSELIPNSNQQDDLKEYFSTQALSKAFDDDKDCICREYNSLLSKDLNWVSISAFKPPFMPGLINKCVISFMDITEYKRVEAERNESAIALEVLSSKYLAVFFANLDDGSFHSLRIPPQYAHIENYMNIEDAFKHYISCYVLDEYKDQLRLICSLDYFRNNCNGQRSEFIFKTIDDKSVRMFISKIDSVNNINDELLIAFEPYLSF